MLHNEPADIRQIIGAVYNGYKLKTDLGKVSFTCGIADDVPAELMLDVTCFSGCLTSLVSNAVQYTPSGHVHIHITMKPVEDLPKHVISHEYGTALLSVIVVDTGMGISNEALDGLFNPLSLEPDDLAKNGSRPDMRLATARRLARLMGGDIKAISSLGHGSEFSLEIKTINVDHAVLDLETGRPVFVNAPGAKQPIKPAPQTNPRGGFTRRLTRSSDIILPPEQMIGLNVLIVEDIVANQEIVRSLLEPAGCNVSVAGDGKEALDLMENQIFDVILMDIRMPILDGIETTKHIRLHEGPHQDVAIIALTADASAENNAQCLAAGADVFLTKPVVLSELFSSIRFARQKKLNTLNNMLCA